MRRVDVGGHELRIDEHGGGAPALVCLHGLVDRLEIWDRCIESLAQRGHTVRLDQRGHGESDSPTGPYRREDLAGDVVSLLDALSLERAVLVGHSMGGIISMTTALAHPERVAGLVLIGTASQCNEKTAGWYERIALAGESGGTDGISQAIYGKRAPRSVTGDAQGIAHVTRTLKSLFDDPLTPKLSDIRCPALLLVGEKDPMGPRASEIIADRMPDATLEVVPGAGHWIHVEAPDVFVGALDPWLAAAKLVR